MKDDLRKQILESGKKLFSQSSYYQTSMESILRDAKIGRATFYGCFKNKEDLFICILENFLDEWKKCFEEATANLDPHDLEGNYRAVIATSFRLLQHDPQISNIVLRFGPGTNELFEPYIERFEQIVLEICMRYLQMGIDTGQFRDNLDIELIANILAAGHLKLYYDYFVKNTNTDEQRTVEKLTSEVFDVLIQGLLATANASPSKTPK